MNCTWPALSETMQWSVADPQEHAELVRLRHECGQLRAQRADQAAQAQGLATQLAAERTDSAALRQENLELATELNEASRDRHATEDAHHLLRERCSELQVGCNVQVRCAAWVNISGMSMLVVNGVCQSIDSPFLFRLLGHGCQMHL